MSERIGRLRLLLLGAPITVLALAVTAHADTIYVCWDGSGDYLTIQEGIDAAQDGDEVVVCDGTYTGPGNRDLDFAGKPITVRSEAGPENCIIDCENNGRGFYFHSGETADAVVRGFTITHGSASVGGGMRNRYYSSPTVVNCVFSANSSTSNGIGGAGMHNTNSSPTVIDCKFIGNTSYAPVFGGGGMANWGSNPTVTNCTFSANSALWDGGGMQNAESSPILIDCMFSANSSFRGGGMYNRYGSSPTVVSCTFSGNSASGRVRCNGGAMFTDGGNLMVANCMFMGNSASEFGGAMFNNGGNLIVANCMFMGNSASEYGGAMLNDGGNLMVANCIMRGDTPDEIRGPAVVTYSDIQGGWPGIGNIDADPLFVDPDGPDDDPNTWEDNDYRLSAGSPCIDAGCNGGVPPDTADLDEDADTWEVTPLDLDGEGRFFDDPETPDTGCGFVPIVDMGAYEFGDTAPQPCPGDMDGDRDVDHSDLGILLSLWGATDQCDLDCDGDIDQGDLGILLAHWNEGCP